MMSLHDQRGGSLVGDLVTLAIVGAALLIMLIGLSTSSGSVALVEQRISAENYARQQMELIKQASYRPNPTAQPYPTIQPTGPYTHSVEVTYWLSATQTFSESLPATDNGMQKIRVQVYGSGKLLFALEDYKVNRP